MQYAKYITYGVVHVRNHLVLKIFHVFIQLLQQWSWCTSFNGFILYRSLCTIRSLRMGNLLYAQNIESLRNISIKLGLSLMIGRCFLIIELMLGPTGLYCVVNIDGFKLFFAFFCWAVDLGCLLFFSKALVISFDLWLCAAK